MSDQEKLSIAASYAYSLLSKWIEISEFGEAIRVEMLSQDPEIDIHRNFVAKLTRFWLELEPKVDSRQELGNELIKNFNNFKETFYSPDLLMPMEKDKPEVRVNKLKRAFELEQTLRKVVEKLGLTKFEGG